MRRPYHQQQLLIITSQSTNIPSQATAITPVKPASRPVALPAFIAPRYQVAYSKTAAAKAALGLSGRLVVQNEGDTDITISPPNITATLNTGQAVPVPSSLVRCPTLTIPGSSSVTCDFTVTKHGSRPIAGSITAFVEVPAANGKPAESAKADAVHFTFMNARLVTEGEFAVVSDFFEPGEGLVQPHSVFGKQPSTNLRIGDSQTFMFTGWYGGLDQALCGKELKVT